MAKWRVLHSLGTRVPGLFLPFPRSPQDIQSMERTELGQDGEEKAGRAPDQASDGLSPAARNSCLSRRFPVPDLLGSPKAPDLVEADKGRSSKPSLLLEANFKFPSKGAFKVPRLNTTPLIDFLLSSPLFKTSDALNTADKHQV